MSAAEGYSDSSLSAETAGLMAVMADQVTLCDRLLQLTQAERVSILQNKVEQLEAVIQEKGSLVERMDQLERRRIAICDGLAPRVGVSVGCSLYELASAINGAGSKDLLALRDQIAAAASALGDANEGNMLLMRKSLELVRASLRQLRRLQDTGEVYTSSGEPVASVPTRSAVDRQA